MSGWSATLDVIVHRRAVYRLPRRGDTYSPQRVILGVWFQMLLERARGDRVFDLERRRQQRDVPRWGVIGQVGRERGEVAIHNGARQRLRIPCLP